MPYPVALSDDVTLRVVTAHDLESIRDAYRRNREHLAPWEPERAESFYTSTEQGQILANQIAQLGAGSGYPLVMVHGSAVIGRMTLSGIVRGPFQSANVGYWVDKEHAGAGLASAALGHLIAHSRDELGLHRIQASTLLHNVGSQRVLRKAGFEPIGVARNYLKIAGRWQDHLLFQRILGA